MRSRVDGRMRTKVETNARSVSERSESVTKGGSLRAHSAGVGEFGQLSGVKKNSVKTLGPR